MYFLGQPEDVGILAIFLAMLFIFYFSLRDGIRGGLIPSGIAIVYYLYIIKTRSYVGSELESSIIATIVLGILYTALSTTIGGLRQKLDRLIENESDEKVRLQTIIDQLPVGVIISNRNGIVTNGNKKLSDLLGKSIRPGMKAGVDTLPLTQADEKPHKKEESPLYQSLVTKKPVTGKEFKISRPDKTHSYVQISATPIKNVQGKIIAAASILTDITERKEVELRKDDFVNMASHELKTPLTSMKLYLEILGKQVIQQKNPKSIRLIEHIHYQTERLQDIVRDLLDVSRIKTGKLTFSLEDFSIDEVVRETIDAVQQTTKNTIIYKEKQRNHIVHADRFRIYQVLTNLLTNASKYSPDPTPIYVTLKKSQGKIQISIKDLGIGVAKSHHKKIFERLYQVTDLKEKTFPGLGIGLYISKEIIRRHKGKIWVESERGKGSTFYFTLPVKK